MAYGGTVNPPRYRKGGDGNPSPTGARASALPDGGEGSKQFMACFERWRGLLWDGCVAVVSKELQDLHDSGRYSDPQCYDLQGEINYFTTNKQCMDYPLYRHLGLPIGSGVIESACKNVVAKRVKQSGMSWTLDGAKEMLQLRASVMSRRFWDDFDGLLPSSPPQRTDKPTWRPPEATTLTECTPCRSWD